MIISYLETFFGKSYRDNSLVILWYSLLLRHIIINKYISIEGEIYKENIIKQLSLKGFQAHIVYKSGVQNMTCKSMFTDGNSFT